MSFIIKDLGIADYQKTYDDMREFTLARDINTLDELWIVQHPSVYTLGQAGDIKHLLSSSSKSDIPLINIDRGGQITYHGIGQIVIYTLLNLHRLNMYVRDLVNKIEESIIQTLANYNIVGMRKEKAPGIYVEIFDTSINSMVNAKIAALGLKITRGCSYHGLALNVDMNLQPFDNINPCGYDGLRTIDMKTVLPHMKFNFDEVKNVLLHKLSLNLF
jgi:lipoyl(octanoyl) transferase